MRRHGPGGRRWAAFGALLLLGGSPVASGAQAEPGTHLLIVTGASGEPRFAQRFHAEATALRNAAITSFGIPDSLVIYLAEDPALDPGAIRARSTRENVVLAVETIAGRARAGDGVFILFIGHGSVQDDVSRFNVPGADLTAADVARLLDRFTAQRVAFVNASSASGDFVKAVSGPNRIVITATKSGFERNETLFSAHFVEAYAKDGADTDKDGRVSLLEAFTYARREVQREYEQSNRLQTEHAVLDGNGDGVGADEPDAAEARLAQTFFLAPAAGLGAAVADSPRARELLALQRQLQGQIDSLRAVKETMPEEEYERALEVLLVRLAETSRELRTFQVRKP